MHAWIKQIDAAAMLRALHSHVYWLLLLEDVPVFCFSDCEPDFVLSADGVSEQDLAASSFSTLAPLASLEIVEAV